MITRVQIKNFKCYGDEGADFPLKRITFIFGDNSAGKSTFLQLTRRICNNWGKVAIGNRELFRSLVFKGDTEREIKIRLTHEEEACQYSAKWNENKVDEIFLAKTVDSKWEEKKTRPNWLAEAIHQEAARPPRTNSTGSNKSSLSRIRCEEIPLEEKYVNSFFEELGQPYELSTANINYLVDTLTGGFEVARENVGAGIDGLTATALSLAQWKRAETNTLLMLEEPESHLNERQISPLMNAIIRAANQKPNGQLIVECHSVLMMEKVRNFVKKKEIEPKDLAVLVATRQENGTIVDEIPLDDNANLLKPWPGGFFPARDQIVSEFFA